MVEVKHLTKRYGAKTAIEDISFTVKPGKIYGLLGPNGAGKSTTMNIMTGYLAATSGEVTIDGHDIFKDAIRAKKHIGYLPEIPPLYLDMTVEEYLMFVAELKGVPKKMRTDEVIDVLEKAQITAVCQKLIRNLSKGYRQRVGLAQALIGNPEVIILDEPTVGLDPKQITEVRDLIRSLKDEHVVILSSHILSEISEVCDHVFIISQGKLVLSDTVENLPLHLQASQCIDIVGQGDVKLAKETLEARSNVASVVAETTEGGLAHLVVSAVSKEDIRADVSLSLAGIGFAIFEMKEVGQSLEDVFLQMTADTYASEQESWNEEATSDEQTEDETEEDQEDDSNL